MPIPFLKKEKFTGSDSGMRYRMEKAEGEDGSTILVVTAWPEPYAFDYTEDSLKLRESFAFNEDGICQGVDWLNEQYEKVLSLKA